MNAEVGSLEAGCKSEVRELDAHVFVEENIGDLEVTVENSVLVQIGECLDDLLDVVPDLEFGETLTLAEHFEEAAVLAHIQYHVEVGLVLERAVQFQHAGVVQARV